MKKQQTTKYRKRQKKEKANRKAKKLATQQPQTVLDDGELGEFAPGAIEKIMEMVEPVAEPISPARRAFQDL